MGRFCFAPWTTISTDVQGSIRPCCRYDQPKAQINYPMPSLKNTDLNEAWNSKEMQNLRQAFIDGVEPIECSWCWAEEKVGIHSFRERYEKRAKDLQKTDLDLIADPPRIYDLKLSNTCNLKCRMCGPQASSLIAKEENRNIPYLYSSKIIDTVNEDIFFGGWLPYMKELELTGGEPFFSTENKKLLQRIGESEYAKNIQILITTNGMFYDKKTLDTLTKFKKVIISFSIDDVGSRLTYQRGGADWEKIQGNILRMRENYPKFRVNIYRTVNIFNIWHLDELDTFCKDNGFSVADGLLHEPVEYSIRNLPDFIKELIHEKYADDESKKDVMSFLVLSSNTFTGSAGLIQTFNMIKRKDRIRNESFAEIYKEWAALLMYYEG